MEICIPPPSPSFLHHHHHHFSSSLTIKTNKFFSAAAKTKPLDHTLRLLPLLPVRDTVTYNTAICACIRHRRPSAALRLFLHLLLSSHPDAITFRSILILCSHYDSNLLYLQLHCYILKLPSLFAASDMTVVYTLLLNLYLKDGAYDVAYQLFVKIPDKDVVAYSSIIRGLTEAGENREGLRVFGDMVRMGDSVLVNEHAYSCALRACAGTGDLSAGRQVHARVVKSGLESDVFVGTGLVDSYVKCEEMEDARKAFLDISRPNVVSCNALLAGSLDGDEGLKLFTWMRSSGLDPDNVTFACVLRACSRSALSMNLVQQFHGLVVKMMEVEVDVFLSSALFEAYIDLGCFCRAQSIYKRVKKKDGPLFNLAIRGYLHNGHDADAVELFCEALRMGKEVREVTATSLLSSVGGLDRGKQLHALIIKFGASMSASLIRMYSKHHHLDDAIRLFDQIPSPDLVLWTDLLSTFSRCGENRRALSLYLKMVSDGGLAEPPNHYTFSTILRSCAQLAEDVEGKQIHAQIVKSNSDSTKSDPFVESALLCMYSKCGYMEEARSLFNGMRQRDLVSWNAMITSLAHHGLAEEAIETFRELLKEKDLEPNHVTFVGVLTACSYCGMVDMGIQYFRSIREPTVDHYACAISLLSRAGRLKEGLDLVEEMPFEPNEIVWSSLLAASSKFGNVSVGEYSAKKLLELDPTDSGTYIALANIYAGARRWGDMEHTRKLMKSQSESKCQGFSWLRVNGQKYLVFADGRSICMSN